MPDYNVRETEPAGEGPCSNCGQHAHLWSDEYENGEYVEPVCVPCLCEIRPSDYPEGILEDAFDHEIMDGVVVLDFGWDLTVEYDFTEERVAASRNPNETDTVIQPSVSRGAATVRYQGEKIGTFKSKSWRKYAEEQVREYYIDHRGRR